ncbi:VOC family protein [Halomonas nitroreducens]|uniref:VOC family protein n=1 Tax=Halomonas nitroreducens TaxID=447425 RepID=A0A431V2A7_9GAMM|nr:VOC family protein [Halomonas nitroreducens]RTR02897.1 VOC family protein [Halomonas nitroreducens]
MTMTPYLMLDGCCESAFRFYADCLGGRIGALMRYAEAPPDAQLPHADPERVMHVRLEVADWVLMGSDTPAGGTAPAGGVWLNLAVESPERAEAVFAALGQAGEVQMPLQETFWAERFGMLVDRFGIPWMVSCEKEA